jgi:hypothetical protein
VFFIPLVFPSFLSHYQHKPPHACTHAHSPENRPPLRVRRHCRSQKTKEQFSGKIKIMPYLKRSAEQDRWALFSAQGSRLLNAGHATLYLASYGLAFKPRNFMASSIMHFLCISGVYGPAAKCHLASRNYFWTRISPCNRAKLASSLFAHSSQALAISSKSFSVPRPNFRAFSRKEPPLSWSHNPWARETQSLEP